MGRGAIAWNRRADGAASRRGVATVVHRHIEQIDGIDKVLSLRIELIETVLAQGGNGRMQVVTESIRRATLRQDLRQDRACLKLELERLLRRDKLGVMLCGVLVLSRTGRIDVLI